MNDVLFRHRRVVAFSETDAAGIVHFAQFFVFLEDCEHAFLRSLGFSVHESLPDGGFCGFPRVHAACDYHAPVRFEDELEIALCVREMRRSTLVYGFEVRVTGRPDIMASGTTTVVCAGKTTGADAMGSMPIPDALRSALVARGAPTSS